MPVTTINISSYQTSISPFSDVNIINKRAKETVKAIALSTTLITGVHAESTVSESSTMKSFIESVAKDQCLNTDRIDLKMLARIREIGTYIDGWDNAKGKSANRQTVYEAEQFARQLPMNIKEPTITLAADGEINFLWILPQFKLDLGMYGDGSYSYYGKISNGKEFMEDEKGIDEKLPYEILALIS